MRCHRGLLGGRGVPAVSPTPVFGWVRRHLAPLALGAAVVLVVVVVALLVSSPGPATRTVTADFAETPGLYAGNDVDVLGIPVGRVTSIHPEPGYVAVRMQVDRSVRLPAGAGAVIMAPLVVSNRFVQLEPAYRSGPQLAAGATIPVSRTAIPQSVDQIVGSLNSLAEQLGPNGANRNGAVQSLVSQLASTLGGSGPDMNSAITSFSRALQGISADPTALAGALSNLGQLSQALAGQSTSYRSLTSNLAQVSQVLAADRDDVSSVMSSLQRLFTDLTSFIDANGANLGSSIRNLDVFATALQREQASLAQAYDLAPLALQNLDNAIDESAPGGAAIVGRNDPLGSARTLFDRVCGNATLRFLVLLATGTQTNPLTAAKTSDTACAVGNALNALTPPPGSAAGPDLTLKALAP